MSKWYVATMNDCIFIIDRKPKPAPVDYIGTEMDCEVCISMESGSKQAQMLAETIVEAHNATVELVVAAHAKPQRKSKKKQVEEALRESDLSAQLSGRLDIDYGHHETLPRGEHVAREGFQVRRHG